MMNFKKNIATMLTISILFTNGVQASYAVTSGLPKSTASYTIKYDSVAQGAHDFIMYTIKSDYSLTPTYIDYVWTVQDEIFGDKGATSADSYFKWEYVAGSTENKYLKNVTSSVELNPLFGVNYNVKSYVGSDNERLINTVEMDNINHGFTGLSISALSGVAINNGSATAKIGNIYGDFVANSVLTTSASIAYGGAVYNIGEIEGIYGNFIGNYTSTAGNLLGGALINVDGGDITLISGDFIGNYVTTTSSGHSSGGGAIINRYGTSVDNESYIEKIVGDFIGNYATSSTLGSRAGAIYQMRNAEIGSIEGDFIGNYVRAASEAVGGAIYNATWTTSSDGGEIGTIVGDFIDNNVITAGTKIESLVEASQAGGGAIYNLKGIIGDITGDFVGNYAQVTTGALNARGGAINNSNKDSTRAKIGNIIGDFQDNRALANTGGAYGGAIFNNNATIGTIDGDFLGNYAKSNSGLAQGGAIYNNSTIGTITSNFIGNYVQSGTNNAQGGAIYNVTATNMVIENSNFYNNHAQGVLAQGGAIFNNGTITIRNSDFVGNYATGIGSNARGGAIENAGTMHIYDSSFIDNIAKTTNTPWGGAIYNTGTLNLYANNEDVTIKGNKEQRIDASQNVLSTENIAFENSGVATINLNGANNYIIKLYDIIKSGTVNLKTGTLGVYDDGQMSAGTFNISANAMITSIDSKIGAAKIDRMTLQGDILYGIDVDLSDGSADSITNTYFSAGSNEILLKEINVIADGGTTATLSNSAAIQQAINIHSGIKITSDVGSFETYVSVTYDKTTGVLEFTRSNLAELVAFDKADKVYVLGATEDVAQNFGNLMGGSSAQLSVVGNDNTIDGNDFEGINLVGSQIYNVSDVSDYNNFTSHAIESSGTVNILNSSFGDKATILNAGTLNIASNDTKTSTFNSTISGLGVINLNTDALNTGTNIFNESVSALNMHIYRGTNTFNDEVKAGINIHNGVNTFAGAISNASVIINDGTNVFNNIDLVSLTLNDGTNTFNSNILADTLNISNGYTLSLNNNQLIDSTNINLSGVLEFNNGAFSSTSGLTSNNGTLDMSNGAISNATLNNLVLTTDLKLNIDVNLSTGEADMLSVTNVSGSTSSKVIIKEINIIAGATLMPSSVQVAKDDMIAKYELDTLAAITTPVGLEEIENYIITYDTNGYLNFSYSNLNNAVSSIVNSKVFNISSSVSANADLGAMQGNSLSINSSNATSSILGANFEGMSVSASKELNLKNILNISGFKNYFLSNSGTVNIDSQTNNTTISSEISNNNLMNLSTGASNKIVIDDLKGSGTTNLSGNAEFKNVENQTINLNAGTNNVRFETTLSGATVTQNQGTVDMSADVSNSIYNFKNGLLNLSANSFDSTTQFNATSGTISTVNNVVQDVNIGDATLLGNVNWALDVSLSTPNADKLVGSVASSANKIIISELNVLSDTTLSYVEVLVADSAVKNAITLGDETITLNGATGRYDAVSYDTATGMLTIDNLGITTLSEQVKDSASDRQYNMSSNEVVETSLGAMGGETLLVNANNKNITAKDSTIGGITSINSNQTITFKNVNTISGFDSGFLTNTGGSVVFSADTDDTTINSDMANNGNNGNIDFNTSNDNKIIINSDITGNGFSDININGDVELNGSISDNTMDLSGSLALGTSAVLSSVNLWADGGYLDVTNGDYSTTAFEIVNLTGGLNAGIEINLETGQADILSATSVSGGKLYIKDLTIVADSLTMPSGGVDIKIAEGAFLSGDYIDLLGTNVIIAGTAAENYAGYMLTYTDSTGMINFKYATLQEALDSSIPDKSYAMARDGEISLATILGGDKLSIDGNGYKIYGSGGINLDAKELSLTDVKLESDINVAGGTLNLFDETEITMTSEIKGDGTININDSMSSGTIYLNSDVSNFTGTTNLNNGTLKIGADMQDKFFGGNFVVNGNSTLDSQNGYLNTFDAQNWTLNSNLNTKIDVDLVNKRADSFINTGSYVDGSPSINITDILITSDTTTPTDVSITNNTNGGNLTLDSSVEYAYSPLYKYIVDSTQLASGGILSFKQEGAVEFSPSAIPAPVAAQAGGYLSQLNSYDQAFSNFDLYIALPRSTRIMMKNANKVAMANTPLMGGATKYSGAGIATEERNSAWLRPYASYENVKLNNGPNVNGFGYGSFFGADSEIVELKNGWDATGTVFGAYTGSSQYYNDVNISQNGGQLGVMGSLFKNDFFLASTISAGAIASNAHTAFGTDNFATLTAGAALKTGYNFEILDGKYIIQPNYLMSYSFVNTFDYVNASGINIHSSPLNAIQLSPGLKFIANLDNGWQPYASVSMLWNLLDETQFKANDVMLPQLSVDPYVQYGLGLQKRSGDRFTGFGQAMIRNGGRNGIILQFGFHWAIGADGKPKESL